MSLHTALGWGVVWCALAAAAARHFSRDWPHPIPSVFARAVVPCTVAALLCLAGWIVGAR